MIFINLTATNDDPFSINVDHIVSIQPISDDDATFTKSLAEKMKSLFADDYDDDDNEKIMSDTISKTADHILDKMLKANCVITVDVPDSKARMIYVKESYVEVMEKMKYFSVIHIN